MASTQPVSPKDRSTAASPTPVPSSVTVTRMPPPSPSGKPLVSTLTQVAPARRAFCSSSLKMSAGVDEKNLVTRRSAPSWTRARIGTAGWGDAFGMVCVSYPNLADSSPVSRDFAGVALRK